jgi:hypothetical protein
MTQMRSRIAKPIAQRVVSSADAQWRGQPGKHRDLPERLAGAQHINDAAAVDDLDLAGAYDIEVGQGWLTGGDDDGARGEVLHFDQSS